MLKAYKLEVSEDKANVFREYEGLTLSSGKKLGQMIKYMEQRLIDNFIEKYRELVDISAVMFTDGIMADTDLSPIATIRHDENI